MITDVSQDKVTLVTPEDEVVGSMDKRAAHRIPAQLHRAISVFLFRKNNNEVELLMQQRSEEKIVGAGQWANTVCGNVWPGETYEACAQRRLLAELQIVAPVLTDIGTYRYHVQCNDEYEEHELDHFFAGWFDGDPNPVAAEVAHTAWVPWEQVLNGTIQQHYTTAPWFTLFIHEPTIMTALKKYLEKEGV